MRKVTRADVAREADVSETIVSYVLNANRYVDKEKRARVLAVVKKLGYRPSPMARALKGKGTNHYLFIADDLMSEHFALIVAEMEKLASKEGICISLCSDRQDWSLLSWQFDGLVIASATMSETRINEYIATGIPVVVLAMKRYTSLKGEYALINSGLEQGTRDAVRLLIEKGRKEIVYVPSLAEKRGEIDGSDWRYIGWREALASRGLSGRVTTPSTTEEELFSSVVEAYRAKPFDAVFARTDSVAAVAMKALTSLSLRVGEDVSVIGVNNSSLSKYLSPSLTSIGIRRNEIASWILELLRRLRGGEEKKELSVLLKTDVVVRETT